MDSLSIPKSAGNTVITTGKAEILSEVAEINAGQAVREGSTFTTSSGRIYGFHDDILYPISGPGTISLSNMQYNLLKIGINNPPAALSQMSHLVNKGILTAEQASQIRSLGGF